MKPVFNTNRSYGFIQVRRFDGCFQYGKYVVEALRDVAMISLSLSLFISV